MRRRHHKKPHLWPFSSQPHRAILVAGHNQENAMRMLMWGLLFILGTAIGSTIARAGPPRIFADDGTYLGTLSNNPYDMDSIGNPYGPYGSPYRPNSIKNPFGPYGSPYSQDSPTNPYARSAPVPGGFFDDRPSMLERELERELEQ